MPHEDERERLGGDEAALSRTVQEHLGRKLRTALNVEAEKPRFLGEPTVPAQFEPLLRKLEASERGERQGYEAVKAELIRPPRIGPRDGEAG